jgi:hypothetical protein
VEHRGQEDKWQSIGGGTGGGMNNSLGGMHDSTSSLGLGGMHDSTNSNRSFISDMQSSINSMHDLALGNAEDGGGSGEDESEDESEDNKAEEEGGRGEGDGSLSGMMHGGHTGGSFGAAGVARQDSGGLSEGLSAAPGGV